MSEENRSKINIKKIIKILFVIAYQILVVMALILTMVIVLQRVSANNQSIGGYRLFRVITGSMEPEYEVGEVVISKEIDPEKIKIGDDIVYLGRYGEYSGKIIMHNVIGKDSDENGNLTFHARGLHSSSVEDPNISEEQIYGVVIHTSKLLTILYNLATNIYSIFIIIIILIINVFIAFNTPKKTKKHKIKQIANTTSDVYKQGVHKRENKTKFEYETLNEQDQEYEDDEYEEQQDEYEDEDQEFEEEYESKGYGEEEEEQSK